MTDLEDQLSGILAELGARAPHDDDLAGRVRAHARRRRLITLGPIAAALVVVIVIAGVWVNRPAATAPVASPPSACVPLQTGPLPDWARAGFSSPEGNPYQLSTNGSIAAMVFANPLVAPADPDRGNKILWATQETPGAADHLVIDGTLEGTGTTHRVDTGTAPGPSYVDMPAPGCWQLTLTWGTHSDTMSLRWDAA
ncbi:MAG: hypothetical protein ABWZ98_07260 [Nakamurella sp.]